MEDITEADKEKEIQWGRAIIKSLLKRKAVEDFIYECRIEKGAMGNRIILRLHPLEIAFVVGDWHAFNELWRRGYRFHKDVSEYAFEYTEDYWDIKQKEPFHTFYSEYMYPDLLNAIIRNKDIFEREVIETVDEYCFEKDDPHISHSFLVRLFESTSPEKYENVIPAMWECYPKTTEKMIKGEWLAYDLHLAVSGDSRKEALRDMFIKERRKFISEDDDSYRMILE